MAYSYWWRRRRWPWRGRWRRWRRRRRVPRRRPRRPVRRYRRRPVRRKRRWGRRGRRRRYVRRYRRRLTVRRKRNKLRLSVWQPQNIRYCAIKGLFPILICGHGKSAGNYAIHSDDYVTSRFSFGGGLSTTSYSLKLLFDQNLRGLNRWTASNDQLDLARYLGATFWFYRDQKTDYIVQYDISEPFKIDKDSSPSYHPGILMRSKHKVIVPSYQTWPKGRSKVKLKIKPPKMFVDKWYTQEDLCNVTLVSLVVSLASLQHPFCRPLTDNPCATFQVLQNFYNNIIGYSSADTLVENVFTSYLYSKASFWQSHLTPSFVKKINNNPDGTSINNTVGTMPNMTNYNTWVSNNTKGQGFYNQNVNVHYNYCQYNPHPEHLKTLRQYYFFWETYPAPANTTTTPHVPITTTKPTKDWWEYRLGLYSPIFLSPLRSSNIEWPFAYRDIVYNPLMDKGVGNMMWFQYNTKPDTQFSPTSCRAVLEDKPLWSMAYGYADFLLSILGEHDDVDFHGLVCIISPYTNPPLYDKSNPKMGYVFYDAKFGNGKWIDGTGFIPVEFQSRWKPELAFQKDVLTDLAMSGPFSYSDDLKNTTIQAKYKFKFKWGGNLSYHQTIRNPCASDGQTPNTSRQSREVQIVDPLTMGPRYVFHSWDWRRGWLNDRTLKRLFQKPLDYEEYPKSPKRPRIFPPTEQLQKDPQEQERDSSSSEESLPTSSEETPPAHLLRVHLRKQLREQRDLRVQLRALFAQVLKTQAGLHINPLLLAPQ
ncbi:ORF1 [Anelloviridae sp.]|nr:ORF1 [Anelloviridae sp.]